MPSQFPDQAFPEEVIGGGMTTACGKELGTMTVGPCQQLQSLQRVCFGDQPYHLLFDTVRQQ